MHRFTLVDQFTLENCFCGLIGQSSSPVQYFSPVVQSSEWIHPAPCSLVHNYVIWMLALCEPTELAVNCELDHIQC